MPQRQNGLNRISLKQERAVRYSEIGAPDIFDLLSENGSEGS